MAWRHRRLLSAPSPAANETAACGGLCDPWCPSNCPFYYPSPPPPPLSPHTQPLPSPDDSSGGSHLSPTVVVVVALLGGIFLLVSYYVVIAKSCFGFRRRRSSRNNRPPRHPPPEDGDDFDPVGGHRMDHPIWYINTVGLNPVIVSAIAVFEYRKSEGLIDVGECTVCLSEFEEGETLRFLPKCSHAFHLSCIDTWLRSHTNCPLCRAPIVAPSSIGTGDRGALPGDRLTSQGSDGNSGDDREGNRAESSVRSGEIGRRTREETADGSGNGIESADGNGERSIKEAVEPTDANHHDLEAVEEISPARRSVSMDASPYTGERESHESPPSDADCPSGDSWVGNSSASTLTGDTSEERRDQRASGVSAPRSLSWSGRFFTPRNNSHSSRSSNSVLPR